MVKVLALVAIIVGLCLEPSPAQACAMKINELVVVLGVADGDVVLVRIRFAEDDSGPKPGATRWRGSATFEVGTKTTVALGTMDPKAKPSDELDRLIGLGRAETAHLAKFTAATRTAVEDCSSKPKSKCGSALLRKRGKELVVGRKVHADPGAGLGAMAEDLVVTSVVSYSADKTRIDVVNVGVGDPSFSSRLESCETTPCRPIWTLHHGEQRDVVVVQVVP